MAPTKGNAKTPASDDKSDQNYVWTVAQEDKLMEMFEDNPILYDKEVPGYNKRDKREPVYAKLGRAVGMPGNEVESRLRQLRDHYMKKTDPRKKKSGSAPENLSARTKFIIQKLGFLAKHKRRRRTTSSIPNLAEASEEVPAAAASAKAQAKTKVPQNEEDDSSSSGSSSSDSSGDSSSSGSESDSSESDEPGDDTSVSAASTTVTGAGQNNSSSVQTTGANTSTPQSKAVAQPQAPKKKTSPTVASSTVASTPAPLLKDTANAAVPTKKQTSQKVASSPGATTLQPQMNATSKPAVPTKKQTSQTAASSAGATTLESSITTAAKPAVPTKKTSPTSASSAGAKETESTAAGDATAAATAGNASPVVKRKQSRPTRKTATPSTETVTVAKHTTPVNSSPGPVTRAFRPPRSNVDWSDASNAKPAQPASSTPRKRAATKVTTTTTTSEAKETEPQPGPSGGPPPKKKKGRRGRPSKKLVVKLPSTQENKAVAEEKKNAAGDIADDTTAPSPPPPDTPENVNQDEQPANGEVEIVAETNGDAAVIDDFEEPRSPTPPSLEASPVVQKPRKRVAENYAGLSFDSSDEASNQPLDDSNLASAEPIVIEEPVQHITRPQPPLSHAPKVKAPKKKKKKKTKKTKGKSKEEEPANVEARRVAALESISTALHTPAQTQMSMPDEDELWATLLVARMKKIEDDETREDLKQHMNLLAIQAARGKWKLSPVRGHPPVYFQPSPRRMLPPPVPASASASASASSSSMGGANPQTSSLPQTSLAPQSTQNWNQGSHYSQAAQGSRTQMYGQQPLIPYDPHFAPFDNTMMEFDTGSFLCNK